MKGTAAKLQEAINMKSSLGVEEWGTLGRIFSETKPSGSRAWNHCNDESGN